MLVLCHYRLAGFNHATIKLPEILRASQYGNVVRFIPNFHRIARTSSGSNSGDKIGSLCTGMGWANKQAHSYVMPKLSIEIIHNFKSLVDPIVAH